jgi:hypothetical protein
LASGICFRASSFSVRLWLNSIIMAVGLQHRKGCKRLRGLYVLQKCGNGDHNE